MKDLRPGNDALGPTPYTRVKELIILCPPPLLESAKKYQVWAHSKQTPTSVKSIEQALKEAMECEVVKIILYSAQIPESYFQKLTARLSLMNPQARSTLRVWPIDGSIPPSGLLQLYHPPRMKALSLLLGGLTLPRALYQAQQAEPISPQNQKVYSFPLFALDQHLKSLKTYSRYSRIPSILGILVTICTLTQIDHSTPELSLTSLFVLAQLLIGVGVIGTIWSAVEHRSLRQRIFLFWADPHLSDQKTEP